MPPREYLTDEPELATEWRRAGYRSFLRTFTVPDDADSSKVSAEFKNGVLSVHPPKSPNAKPKSVEVKVA